jgi:proteasome activator subunit 4
VCITAGQLKEHLRVLLLRIESTFSGLRTCLPDFPHPVGESSIPSLAGASGVTVGSSALREEAAEIIHQACEYVSLSPGRLNCELLWSSFL